MNKISSKMLEKEQWISFENGDKEIFLSEQEVDELVLDTHKWALKLNVQKLKENKKFMTRVKEAHERKKN